MDELTEHVPESLRSVLMEIVSITDAFCENHLNDEYRQVCREMAVAASQEGLPIRQGIAVTGSVNQKGQVQAIGGVNEKIEGFFAVCRAKGLTGEQGVIIPDSNMQNLMLKEEVLEAVREGNFHVWAVKSIDEGIEILTGIEAGQAREDGTFAEGTVNRLVDDRLTALAEKMKEFARPDGIRNGQPE